MESNIEGVISLLETKHRYSFIPLEVSSGEQSTRNWW